MESKDLLDLCRQAGIDVKNQLSSLDPDQRDVVEQLVKRGGGAAVAVAPPPPKPVNLSAPLSSAVPVLPARAARPKAAEPREPEKHEAEPARPAATPPAPTPPTPA